MLLAVIAVATTFAAVGFVSASLTGGYLLFASSFDVNLNEVFAGQSIEDYKGFLRMHIDVDGELTIYPIGLRRVCHKWRADPTGEAEQPWLAPAAGPLEPQLIEAPIRVPREQKPSRP
jgi:hypothetical protein